MSTDAPPPALGELARLAEAVIASDVTYTVSMRIDRPNDDMAVAAFQAWQRFIDAASPAVILQLVALASGGAETEATLAAHEEIFRWLLGESGEFPQSEPGRRYGFRSELRRRLAALTPERPADA